MKNIVRAFVAALVLTGTVAAAHAAKSTDMPKNTIAHSAPQPTCEPGVPDGCGI